MARRLLALLRRVAPYAGLCLAVLFALLPILWACSTALKPGREISAWPPHWIPDTVTLQNFDRGVWSSKFLLYLRNTIIVIALALALAIPPALHAAWAAARLRFRGKQTLLLVMWATTMIPGIAVLVPLYLIAVQLGLFDTFWVLAIVYGAWAVPTLVWLLRRFMAAVPVELEEAAMLDGCSRLGAFYRVTLRLTPAGIFAGAVFVFVNIWNEFMIGYGLVQSDAHRIIQVGLYAFVTEVGIEWGPMMATLTASLVPIFLFYFLLQRFFIRGLIGGAVKG
jgi:ABC-type glycerol-3-phosphate transport system permease component